MIVYQNMNIRILDITNRSNIIQRVQWNFANYTNSSIRSVKALTPTTAFVCIVNNSGPAQILLMNLNVFVNISISQRLILQSSDQNPSAEGQGVVFTSTDAYWTTSNAILKLNFATWTLSSVQWPQPFDKGMFSPSFTITLFQNSSALILSVINGFDVIFLDITSFQNPKIVSTTSATDKAPKPIGAFPIPNANTNLVCMSFTYQISNTTKPFNTVQSYSPSIARTEVFIPHPCLPDDIALGCNVIMYLCELFVFVFGCF